MYLVNGQNHKVIRLGSLLGRPLSIFPLIGERRSKILGKEKLPKILLIPSPQQERVRERSAWEKA
jgi:hypothetical protein